MGIMRLEDALKKGKVNTFYCRVCQMDQIEKSFKVMPMREQDLFIVDFHNRIFSYTPDQREDLIAAFVGFYDGRLVRISSGNCFETFNVKLLPKEFK